MAQWLRGYRAALWIGWVALCIAGISYARIRGVPGGVAAPVLAAFLIEYPFYLVAAFPSVRERVAGARLPFFLTASIVLPYLVACGAGAFHWIALVKLIAVALALGLWFVALPAGAATDLGFLALLALVLLGRYFDGIYSKPFRGVDLSILGKIAVFQMATLALMLARRAPETGYGFLPTRREWRIGTLHFLYFIPVGLPLALALKAVQFPAHAPSLLIVGMFLGYLWVVALNEEFLLRGFLQPLMEQWTSSRAAGLLLTSAVFGLVHLPFRGVPNWRWVLIAATLGWFCGRARNQAGGIRAGMVTHALTIAAWRGFFV